MLSELLLDELETAPESVRNVLVAVPGDHTKPIYMSGEAEALAAAYVERGGEVGRCAVWRGEIGACGFQKALHRLRTCFPERDQPRFLLYLLRIAAERGAFADGHESTFSHLTGEKLRAHRFVFPPENEQAQAVRAMDGVSERAAARSNACRRQIDLAQEFRTRLIADVVTGKLDVREAAARLPEVGALGVEDDGGSARLGWRSGVEEATPASDVGDADRISVRADVFGGKPIIRDLRIAVEHVLGMLGAGDTPETILREYPELDGAGMRACLRFAYRSMSGEAGA